ncbi:MAG: FHA domain-containing protein [Planctomycetota bacterium]|nr:MAG: FHA domain-containing protein [Planctomycetota bacterium]REJ92378.1 MAG: FHA domain-containing protein [Planctomycetota bacterium]REK30298.1 MAG: FHA domain-containing protein [Planctomycetota bacterium]REK44590.1 MAG: FHA domain-containing protein [Planctomycetota bacterium]
MTLGNRAGSNFRLEPDRANRVGRGLECAVVLTDPLCSRVHATIHFDGERWFVKDAGSRNGTFVNDQKVDDATLTEGCQIRVGSTEFTFCESVGPPTTEVSEGGHITQTIVCDHEMSWSDVDEFALAALTDKAHAEELLVLYQLSIKLLRCADPDEVVRQSLELLQARTQAAVVGFLWVNEEGKLKPKMVIPQEAADKVKLSDSLTELVVQQGHAVWIANQRQAEQADSLQHFADALCVPLRHEKRLLGALHVYRDFERFSQTEFDFTLSLANILTSALARAREQSSLQADFQQLVAQSPGYDEMIGECPAMQELKARIERVAGATGCVLIRGESGTGKELVARAIHRASPRADRPMLSVNCAAIPADLMESQLFGHQAGSFTGADRDHEGYFQQADLGTLFLDEIGELTPAGQAKLLRILEGHSFLPIGSTEPVSVDVRVIAATNRDLEALVREKQFREDLYYRLTVFALDVPPLRERGEDLARLVDSFLDHYRLQHGRAGLVLSDAAREKLLSYSWPGNVRQLRNVMDSAVVLALGNSIEPGDLGLREVAADEIESLRLSDWEVRLIQRALQRVSGNVAEAAKLLGIGRATLYRKLEEYDIER